MAEYRKSSHGEAFPLDELVDIQINSWSSTNLRQALNRPPFNAKPPAAPPPTRFNLDKVLDQVAAGKTPAELEELAARRPPTPRDVLRQAFSDFLAEANWRCEACDKPVEPSSLKIPPPVDGVFHMYCSETCAA